MGHPRTALTSTDIDRLAWDRASGGLLPAIVQDAATLQVLVLAWMNPESLAETLDSGEVSFWSRSRQARWRKGDTSGNRLRVVEVLADCDADSLLVTAEPLGPACHEGLTSCFGDQDAPGLGRFARLEHTIAGRQTADPVSSYTARLLSEGPIRCAQKVGEEGVETALAGAVGTDAQLREEAADLLFHLLVLLRSRGLRLGLVLEALRLRAG